MDDLSLEAVFLENRLIFGFDSSQLRFTTLIFRMGSFPKNEKFFGMDAFRREW